MENTKDHVKIETMLDIVLQDYKKDRVSKDNAIVALTNIVGTAQKPMLDLSRYGFTIIRGLLDGRISGGKGVALELAEALHNIPCSNNDYQKSITMKKLTEFTDKHPHFDQFKYHMEQLNIDYSTLKGQSPDKAKVISSNCNSRILINNKSETD